MVTETSNHKVMKKNKKINTITHLVMVLNSCFAIAVRTIVVYLQKWIVVSNNLCKWNSHVGYGYTYNCWPQCKIKHLTINRHIQQRNQVELGIVRDKKSSSLRVINMILMIMS